MSFFSHESNFRLEGTEPQPEIRVIQSLSPLKALPASSANHSICIWGTGQECVAVHAACSSEINPSTTYKLWTLEWCLLLLSAIIYSLHPSVFYLTFCADWCVKFVKASNWACSFVCIEANVKFTKWCHLKRKHTLKCLLFLITRKIISVKMQ